MLYIFGILHHIQLFIQVIYKHLEFINITIYLLPN